MNKIKLSLIAGLAIVAGGMLGTSEASAQVFVGPSIVGPRVVARAVVPGVPVVRPVVYRAPIVAPVTVYRTYSPVVAPVPVVRSTVVRTSPVVVTTRVRPALVPALPIRSARRLRL